ncbi:MAG: FlgD immunoglobulin-like domain containing protein, partial [Chitinivibrionales bacterium]
HPLTGTPLATPAQWIEVGADGAQAFSIATRPPLKPADSLLWHIQAAQSSGPARSGDSTSDVPGALFLFDTLSQTWCNKITVSHSNRWFRSAPTNLGGPFAYGATNDTTAPRIQALIGGREMPTVDYTPRNKAFTFIITDPSGIDQQSVSLHLNHDTLSSAYWNLTSDQQDKSSVTITALPPREQSVDSLTVTANDLAGNRARQTFAYLPGEKLAITFFSCHPNPFTARPGKKIRFAFVLTDIAEEVSISIFSIASRRIASFDLDPNRIGYQEFAWDGLTDNGYRIANGTYYAKITARNRRRKVKKIIRIVKLEGF